MDQVIEVVSAIIMVVDVAGNITSINKKGARMLGYKREEIIGKNWLQHFAPERWTSNCCEVFKKLQKGELPSHYTRPFLRKDGSSKDVILRYDYSQGEERTYSRAFMCGSISCYLFSPILFCLARIGADNVARIIEDTLLPF